MSKWEIKKIKNEKSKYDFRLISKNNDYTNLNFFKYSMFRIIVSLSSYLTNGIIYKKGFYKINYKKNVPAIFEYSINKIKESNKYITVDDELKNIIFFKNKDDITFINIISKPDTRIFSSLFKFEDIYDVSKFLLTNKKAYSHILLSKQQRYILTGWISLGNDNNIILDLLKYDKKKTILTRCKIHDLKIIKKLNKLYLKTKKKIKSYCLIFVNFKKYDFFKIDYIIPITFDEYITYIYDLMLPYKYDFNDKDNLKTNKIKYNNNDIERYAFAIDPDGSKDRDDAISAFYLDKNYKITNLENATFIKLIVHISDTLSYIQPKKDNYYYHYSKYKCNTDYLDKYNLPMMDRILSENYLSLEGNNNDAITISISYKIIDKKNFIIYPFPEKVKVNQSSNLHIYGTTYKKFSESFELNKKNNFDNSKFIKRLLIKCNNKLNRDINEFIYEGESMYPNKTKKIIANNLKQLYIFFVNSLNHTGKDTLIKLPSNLVRHKISGKTNIYLDFSPIDMWSHSLIEYTALESNIYFSYLMYSSNENKLKNKSLTLNDILKINENVGNKNINLLFDNTINRKNIKLSKNGIYRNLYSPSLNQDFYLNEKIRKIIIKLWSKNKNKQFIFILQKFLENFKYNSKQPIIEFLKLVLSLRQVILLLNSKTNLDVSSKLISKEIKMKAKYDFFPIGHFDICSLFYTHATSPMRRFVDINVHNLIFNSHKKYIYSNLDLEGINNSVKTGKHIHQLVNSKRLSEFIEINNRKIITYVKIIDKKTNLIGLVDFASFYSFNSIFKIKYNKEKTLILLKNDSYDIPFMELSKGNQKPFNIFFHMLKKENKSVVKKCQMFLEKIFNIKSIKKIC